MNGTRLSWGGPASFRGGVERERQRFFWEPENVLANGQWQLLSSALVMHRRSDSHTPDERLGAPQSLSPRLSTG